MKSAMRGNTQNIRLGENSGKDMEELDSLRKTTNKQNNSTTFADNGKHLVFLNRKAAGSQLPIRTLCRKIQIETGWTGPSWPGQKSPQSPRWENWCCLAGECKWRVRHWLDVTSKEPKTTLKLKSVVQGKSDTISNMVDIFVDRQMRDPRGIDHTTHKNEMEFISS